MSFSYFEIFLIISSQVILLFIYNLFIKKDIKKQDIFKDKLELINSIFKHTKHNKIVQLEDIKKIELDASNISVFSADIYRDVKDEGQFSNEIYNVGTFYDTVSKNLNNNKIYNYFIKRDANFRHSLINYFTSHTVVDKVKFFIVPSEKYYFYDEIYLYEYDNGITAKAYEFLPSISDEKEERLYYLELDDKQVKRLQNIKQNLASKYEESSTKEVEKIKSKIDEFTIV